jgi:hypothetical protein
VGRNLLTVSNVVTVTVVVAEMPVFSQRRMSVQGEHSKACVRVDRRL